MPNQEFLDEIDTFERETLQELRLEVEGFIEQILLAICVRNSVAIDTGRSTASWVTSTGQPIFYIAADVTEFSKLATVPAIARSLRTVQNLAGYQLGDPVYIANGNDYVIELEFDSKSRKLPNGFVRLALAGFPEVQYRLSV